MGSANNPDRPRAYARVITEHQDNVAWENDRVAFRVYSQQAPNKAASGVDFWAKSVDRPIIDEWYGKEAAGGSYQVDSGSGCDFYNMGVNRGIGGTGIWNGDTLVCPQVYRTVKMENQGPELLSFTLDYAPYEAFGRTIQEEKRIEMICGTSFYKVSHTIVTSDGKDAVLGVGIGDFGSPEILVAEDGKLFVSEKVHHKTRVGIGSHDQDCEYFDSEIGGAVIANPSSSAGTAVCGHNQLQLIKVPSGQTVTYYVGADWTFQQNSGRWPGGKKFWTMCAQNETFAGLSQKYLKAGASAEILTRPTFNNCSVKLEPEAAGAVLEYRKAKGKWSPAHDFKGSLMGLDEDIDSSYPKRPLPFTLSRARVSVGLSREPVVIDIAGKLPKNCDIRKPDACDWFDVKLENKKLVISFDDSKMNQRRKYRGAFILRTPAGLSRPVSIYAETSFVPSLRPSKPGVFVQYIDGFSLKSGEKKTVSFTLEKSGRYWIMLHGKIEKPVNDFEIWQSRPHAVAGVDGQALEKISLQMFDYPTWSMMNPGGNLYSFVRHYDLKAGRHTIHIDASDDPGKYYFDDIAITDDPAAFEPNRID